MTDRKEMVFQIRVTPPSYVTKAEMRAYIEDAVAAMKGSYHPNEPIFELDGTKVKVLHDKVRK